MGNFFCRFATTRLGVSRKGRTFTEMPAGVVPFAVGERFEVIRTRLDEGATDVGGGVLPPIGVEELNDILMPGIIRAEKKLSAFHQSNPV